jgi:hypothetical protein
MLCARDQHSAQLRAAPTVVVEQRYDSDQRCTVPAQPEHTALVFPHQGNFLTFAGDLGHGVIESLDEGLRMTLLINWWTHQPQVCRRKRLLRGGKKPVDSVITAALIGLQTVRITLLSSLQMSHVYNQLDPF